MYGTSIASYVSDYHVRERKRGLEGVLTWKRVFIVIIDIQFLPLHEPFVWDTHINYTCTIYDNYLWVLWRFSCILSFSQLCTEYQT